MSTPSIAMHKVKSSNIAEIGHDADSQTLAVKFSNGTTYHYSGVSAKDFAHLREAKSIGAHFSSAIRAKFKGMRQEEPKRRT